MKLTDHLIDVVRRAGNARSKQVSGDRQQLVRGISVRGESVGAEPAGAAPEKPWLITPTVSSNPKLGTEVGVLAAYLKQLDAHSTPSMTGLSATYSDTDSSTLALFSQLYWGGDGHRLTLLAATAEVNNEYDDFLGSGQSAETRDSVHTVGFRYLTRLSAGGWFAGAQEIGRAHV